MSAPGDHTPEPEGGTTISVTHPLDEQPGTTIGPYKLLQKIGEGGMGTVFMAEQTQPVRRKVALKVIKPGMDTAQVIARFGAERQALAIMDHPNIARVLDVGATDTGRPFFVMELVKGVPITEYCDRNHLTPRERLELFIPVCQAIQHAHQKGIIHRDIKPSNVLVTLHDGTPVPKVIDFGVAKAIDQRLTERTMFTAFGAVIGTLEYMSPEQAEMGALDIDTRSDIYSLGVLLYELLTGSTPLERAKLREAVHAEILRRIREEEPTKPSTRLSESKDALPSISAQRKMEPARLTKLVRGELDWIVMKSLEKDRTRRYETANGFARDIQRYLDGDAVEACPPSASYKLRKFARKHRAALMTAGAFALLLVAATAISVGLALWADRERARAGKAEKLAKDQQGRAQEREQMAIDAVKRYGDVVRETPELKNNPGLARLRATLLKEPQAFFKRLRDRLQADRETTPDSLARLATASFSLGQLMDEIGDKRDAMLVYAESLAIRERLARENTKVTEFQSSLAETYNSIGVLQMTAGQPDAALASFRKALAVWGTLTGRDRSRVAENSLASLYNNIGILMITTGRPAGALASYREAMKIHERLVAENPAEPVFQHNLCASFVNIALLHRAAGKPAEAIESLRKGLKIEVRLARDNPSVIRFQSDLARSHHNMAMFQNETGQLAGALGSERNAQEILERLARENPTVTEFQSTLGTSYNGIGVLQCVMGRPGDGLTFFRKAIRIFEKLVLEHPSVTRFQNELATSQDSMGNLKRMTGRGADALEAYGKALEIRERLANEHPESPEFLSNFGGTLNNVATAELDEHRPEPAREKLLQAIVAQRKALAANPNHPAYRQFLANHFTNLIRASQALGLEDEAAEARRALNSLRDVFAGSEALDARLAAVLRGEQAPKDSYELILLAMRAGAMFLPASSARLYGEGLGNNPKLADDRQAGHRFNAACAAALAGTGQGKDDPPPDDAAKAKLRRQALDWLKAELAAWAKILDAGPGEMKAKVAPTLQHWQTDADLAGIRDEKELARLPDEERAAFHQLWKDVNELLTKATSRK